VKGKRHPLISLKNRSSLNKRINERKASQTKLDH
jgi:hypothetical protein